MNRRAMARPSTLPLILAPLALALSACSGSAPADKPPLADAAIGGSFTLVDKAGRTVTDRSFPGKYLVVYFGYTYCPDACPADVSVLTRGLKALEKSHPDKLERIQPLFITIDPQRDTPARVGEFAAAFSPRLIGLTGTPEQIASVARKFGAYYARNPDSKGSDYLMDHSRIAYLIGPDGKPIAMLPVDKGPDAVAAELARWVS